MLTDPTGLTAYLKSIGKDELYTISQLNRILSQSETLENETEFIHWYGTWQHRNGLSLDEIKKVYRTIS